MEPSSSSSSVPAATAISSQNGGLAQPSSRDDLFDIFGGGAEPELEIEISGGRYAPDAAPVPALPYQPPPPPPPLDSTYLSDTFPQPFDLGDPASSSAYPLFGGLDPARDTSILPSTSAFPVGLATTSLERSSPAATAQAQKITLNFPPEITKILAEEFSRNDNPPSQRLRELALQTGLSEEQVGKFFENRRARAKKRAGLLKGQIFESQLLKILDDSGGVSDERHAPRLVQLMEEANDNLEQQALLLNVLLSTAHQLTLVRFVSAGGLAQLNRWLEQTTQRKDAKAVLRQLFKVLARLPVSSVALRGSGIARTLRNLKSSVDRDIADSIDRLFSKWLPAEPGTGGFPAATDTPPGSRSASTISGTPSKTASHPPHKPPLQPARPQSPPLRSVPVVPAASPPSPAPPPPISQPEEVPRARTLVCSHSTTKVEHPAPAPVREKVTIEMLSSFKKRPRELGTEPQPPAPAPTPPAHVPAPASTPPRVEPASEPKKTKEELRQSALKSIVEKRGRGRPRKVLLPPEPERAKPEGEKADSEAAATEQPSGDSNSAPKEPPSAAAAPPAAPATTEPPKRKRGRPRKYPPKEEAKVEKPPVKEEKGKEEKEEEQKEKEHEEQAKEEKEEDATPKPKKRKTRNAQEAMEQAKPASPEVSDKAPFKLSASPPASPTQSAPMETQPASTSRSESPPPPSAKGKLDGRGGRKRHVEFFEDPTIEVTGRVSKAAYAAKPLSADDIRKEKLKQKLGLPTQLSAPKPSLISPPKSTPKPKLGLMPALSSAAPLQPPPGASSVAPPSSHLLPTAATPTGHFASQPITSPPISPTPKLPPLFASSAVPPAPVGPSSSATGVASSSADAFSPEQPPTTAPASPPSQPLPPQKKSKVAKSVRWADVHADAPLTQVRTFIKEKEVRPELKGLAAGQRQLVALAKMEHAREREEILKKKAQEQSARLTSQQMSPSISWKTPKLLELDPSPPAPVETEESRAQRERESRVLSDISFSLRDKTIDLSKIPPSPAEAPAEPEEGPPPVDIPFDEVVQSPPIPAAALPAQASAPPAAIPVSPAAQALVSALPGLTSSFPALTAALSAPQIQLPPPGDLSNSATALAFVANMLANPTLAPLVSSLLAAQMQQQQQQQTQLQQPALHPSAGGYPTAYAQPLSAQYSVDTAYTPDFVPRGGFGRGAGGGGRGRKRFCPFFNSPSGCKKGDYCDMIHDQNERNSY